MTSFKNMMEERRAVLVPGAFNALAARIIVALGFEAIYVTGAGVTNMLLGMPDLGFIDLSMMAQTTAMIRNVTELPLVVDADTGFGNAVNVGHTVRTLERAGATAIQLEDQQMPKRCGHFEGKRLVPVDEMVAKVQAAVDARHSAATLIIARTDARASEGLDGAIERAVRYAEAGADMTFVEAPQSVEEMRQIPARVPAPQIINLVVGGKTPILDRSELEAFGFGLVLYANVALQGAIHGTRNTLQALANDGRMDENDLVATFADRQKFVRKDLYDDLDRKYATE
jgi:2-methylisocitrate lyase-like PEP mutase family enzyme